MAFVFFDTETTGLQAGFDQILHFAAVRTDADLREMDRFEIRARLLPHVLPHPRALHTNGLPIGQLTDLALPSHYAMVSEIRRVLLSWSPAIFAGFNSMRFDEEMLRHAFFQNLHPAYLTSGRSCGRTDVLSLAMAADALSPAQLVVPSGPDGRRTFRLQALALANQVGLGRAHDAMSDVLATIGLCRLVYQRAPEVWHQFVRFSNKRVVGQFMEDEDGFVLTEFYGGTAYHAPVVCLGPHPDVANGRLCLNLQEDLDRLALMTEDELRQHFSQKPCPVRRVRTNAAPTLSPLYDVPERMVEGMSIDDAEARARRVKDDEGLRSRLVRAYVASRPTYPVSPHLEGRLYDGFPSREDEALLEMFHQVPWADRPAIVSRLEDARLRWFGERLIYFEARMVLPASLRSEVEQHLASRLTGYGTGYLTCEEAIDATDGLLEEELGSRDLLSEYRRYLVSRKARVNQFLNGLAA